MPFEAGHKKIEGSGRQKKEIETLDPKKKSFIEKLADRPDLQKKYLRELKHLKGKQFVDSYHTALEFSKPKLNKIDPTKEKPQKLTINFIAATKDDKQIEQTLDITPHEEINPDN